MNEAINKAIKFILEDATKKYPLIIDCIFDSNELITYAGIEIDLSKRCELMDSLEKMHVINKTDKESQYGPYYNISIRLVQKFFRSEDDRKFISPETEFVDGFCVIPDKAVLMKRIRQRCKATKCKFFLKSENVCVRGKKFV